MSASSTAPGGAPGPGGLRGLLSAWVFDKQVPAGVGFLRALGTALGVVLVAQALTGMLLALCYVPSPDHAYDSIRYLDEEVRTTLLGREFAVGRFLRGFHHWGASAVIVLAGLHLLRVFATGAYKRPRALLWVVGVAILGVLLGFGFTGYLLPWDMKAFFATDVGVNIVAQVPRVGPALADLLRGGPELGAPTLTRMFALHVLFLPALLLPLAGLHLLLVHQLGITPPGARVDEPEVKGAPFFPDHVVRELLVATLALAAIALVAWRLGAPLEAPANRDAHGYEPRPEWYFLGLFQLLKLFEGQSIVIPTVIVPGGVATLLLLLPWLDRGKERSPAKRPFAMTIGMALLAAVVGLTAWGWRESQVEEPSKPPPYVRVGDLSYVPPSSPPFAPPRAEGAAGATSGGDAAGGGAEGSADGAAAVVAKGEALVASYECTACHLLHGAGDTSGAGAPELTGMKGGHDAAWFALFLLDPVKVRPDIEMPSAADLEMNDGDRAALAAWLAQVSAR
ncbi:MAG: cytochrome b N-terminal domain-containing protein [Planctomycetes bacterium]|nr:cytochrome b N-terminal domain-containing protein [Planctomycetota bacterium]